MKEIAVFGAGSYGEEIACLIKKINNRLAVPIWNFIGFFDDDETLWGKNQGYGKILGGKDIINEWKGDLSLVLAIANGNVLKKIVDYIKKKDVDYPNIIDPDTSFLDKDSFHIGKGNVVGEGSRFATKCTLGDFNIIVNDSIFGHDDKIGNFNIFFPASRLSGHVTVGDFNTFGVETTVIQGHTVGNNVKFTPGSFLMSDTEDGFTYRGNPARKTML